MVDQSDVTYAEGDSTTAFIERRRPGRIDYQDPELIRLLRQDYPALPDSGHPTDDTRDDLGASLGLVRCVYLSLVLWDIDALLMMYG